MKDLNVYLVYEHESFDEYAVILLTKDEEKAKFLSGENKPCDWNKKENDETDRYYLTMELEKEYSFDIMSTHTF